MTELTNLEKYAEQYKGTERDIELPWLISQLPPPGAKILDIGCSYSPLLEHLNDIGYIAHGIDMKPYEFRTDQRFILGDARDLNFPDGYFDCVYSLSSIEHFGLPGNGYNTDKELDADADLKALQEMWRVLKVGGVMLLTLPAGEAEETYKGFSRFYNMKGLVRLLNSLTTVQATVQWFTKADNWQVSHDTETPTFSRMMTGVEQVACLIARK